MQQNKIIVFKDKNIRRLWYKDEWWFSVIDIVGVLTDSNYPRRYWSDLKRNLFDKEGFFELYEKIGQLKFQSTDGKFYATDAANTETMFRIIQSIPSPKAEPFKYWLAKVGYERVQEIEDPELATKRTRELYKSKGYSDAWIKKRMRGIAVRDELTREWGKSGVKEGLEYAILTSEISKATFGMTVAEYKKHKDIKKENLRDHMTDLELVFSMLGEASTTEIAKVRDAQGLTENKTAARDGGSVAGNARKYLERKTKQNVITSKNYLNKRLPKA